MLLRCKLKREAHEKLKSLHGKSCMWSQCSHAKPFLMHHFHSLTPIARWQTLYFKFVKITNNGERVRIKQNILVIWHLVFGPASWLLERKSRTEALLNAWVCRSCCVAVDMDTCAHAQHEWLLMRLAHVVAFDWTHLLCVHVWHIVWTRSAPRSAPSIILSLSPSIYLLCLFVLCSLF